MLAASVTCACRQAHQGVGGGTLQANPCRFAVWVMEGAQGGPGGVSKITSGTLLSPQLSGFVTPKCFEA